MIEAKGRAGSWFAVPKGETEQLPCVHRKWHNPEKGTHGHYWDKSAYIAEKEKWDTFIEAIKSKKRVILTEEHADHRRAKYIAIYDIDNVLVDETGLYFDFIKRTKG